MPNGDTEQIPRVLPSLRWNVLPCRCRRLSMFSNLVYVALLSVRQAASTFIEVLFVGAKCVWRKVHSRLMWHSRSQPAPPSLLAKVARGQNLIPSFLWIAPGWRAWRRNPRKGRDQILQRSVAEPLSRSPKGHALTI